MYKESVTLIWFEDLGVVGYLTELPAIRTLEFIDGCEFLLSLVSGMMRKSYLS